VHIRVNPDRHRYGALKSSQRALRQPSAAIALAAPILLPLPKRRLQQQQLWGMPPAAALGAASGAADHGDYSSKALAGQHHLQPSPVHTSVCVVQPGVGDWPIWGLIETTPQPQASACGLPGRKADQCTSTASCCRCELEVRFTLAGERLLLPACPCPCPCPCPCASTCPWAGAGCSGIRQASCCQPASACLAPRQGQSLVAHRAATPAEPPRRLPRDPGHSHLWGEYSARPSSKLLESAFSGCRGFCWIMKEQGRAIRCVKPAGSGGPNSMRPGGPKGT
jgi:hypothetical protein